MAERLGEAILALRTDDRDLDRGIRTAEGKAQALAGKFDAFGQRAMQVGTRLSLAITAPLTILGKQAFDAAIQSREALAQVETALTSMDGASGKTAEQLQKAAKQLETFSNFDDDDILQKVTANLLTFGNVSGDVFDRAQQAAVNLSARLGQDLQSSAIQLGKALNDPVAGITALSRVGVSFTEDQKAMIKAMAEVGDIAGAQAIILGELEKQFGGAAKAARDAAPGGDQAQAWRTLLEVVGERLVQAFEKVEQVTAPIINAFLTLSPEVQTAAIVIAGLAAAAGPLLIVIGMMASGIGALIPLFAGLAIPLGPVALALAAVAAAGALIYANWEQISPLLGELAEKFEATIGADLRAKIDEIMAKLRELWDGPLGEMIRTAIGMLMEFQTAYAGVLGELLLQVLDAAVTAVGGAFSAIVDALTVVSRFLQGDFSGAWQAAGDFVTGIARTIAGVIEALFPGLIELGSNIIRGIVNGIRAAPGAVRDALMGVIKGGVDAVKDFLGIRSPSLLFMGIAENIIRGLTIGLDRGAGEVRGSMSDVFAGIPVPGGSAGPDGSLPGLGQQDGDAMRDTFSRTFADGIRAALRGDLGGFLDQFFNRLFDSSLRNAADALGSALFGGGGGGIGAALGQVFAGFFASGGTIPNGQFGIVGERGPELAFAGRGGMDILSNADSRKLLSGGGGGTSINMPITIDATGADPAAIARLRSQLAELEQELPSRVVATVREAQERRVL